MPTPYEFHAAFFSMKFPKREQNESIPQYEQRVRDSLHVQINQNREQAQKGKLYFLLLKYTKFTSILTDIF